MTIDKITDSGSEIVRNHDSMKEYYSQKISELVSLVQDTFDELHLLTEGVEP